MSGDREWFADPGQRFAYEMGIQAGVEKERERVSLVVGVLVDRLGGEVRIRTSDVDKQEGRVLVQNNGMFSGTLEDEMVLRVRP